MLPNTYTPLSEFTPPPEPQHKPEPVAKDPEPDGKGITWHPLRNVQAPKKAVSESPTQYIKRVDKWSCKLMADERQKLRNAGDGRPLRRRWHDFTLIVEAGKRDH